MGLLLLILFFVIGIHDPGFSMTSIKPGYCHTYNGLGIPVAYFCNIDLFIMPGFDNRAILYGNYVDLPGRVGHTALWVDSASHVIYPASGYDKRSTYRHDDELCGRFCSYDCMVCSVDILIPEFVKIYYTAFMICISFLLALLLQFVFRGQSQYIKRSYSRGVWTRRKVYWRQKMVSRALYVTLARQRRLTNQTYANKEVSEQHVLAILCHSITEMMELVVNKVFAEFRATATIRAVYRNAFQGFKFAAKSEEFMTVIGIHLITLLMGPAFSSDIAGDGPEKDQDNKSKDKEQIDERSTSSESQSDDRECRPPTPTKPQGMGKRKYKNLVRSHRRQYPKAIYKDSTKSKLKHKQDNSAIKIELKQKKTLSKASRERKTALQSLKRRRSPDSRIDEHKQRWSEDKQQDNDARDHRLQMRRNRRIELGTRARSEDIEAQKKKRAAIGPGSRKTEIEKRLLKGPEARAKEIALRRSKGPEARAKEVAAQKRKRNENPNARNIELRKRKKARRDEQLRLDNEPYNFWVADAIPSDEQLRHFETHPGTAVAMFRLMAGVRKNHLRRPENLRATPDAQSIIDRFSDVAGHNATIRVCAVCSIRDVLVGEDCKEMPITHIYIQLLKFDKDDLPANQSRLARLRIVTVEEEHYRIDPAGFDASTNMVTVCAYCEKTLFYSRTTNRLPRQSIAFHDPGTIPARLPKLSLIELLAISKNLVYTSVFHMRPIAGVAQIGLKGHSYVLPIDTVDSAASLLSKLPRDDLSKHVMVGFMGTKSVYKLVKEMARRLGPLSMNPKHVFMWLYFLKEVENPYYINIEIPTTDEERAIASRNMLQHVAEVIDSADVCDSAAVLSLDRAQRSELEDSVSGVDESTVDKSIRVDTVLLSQVHTVRNPLDLALEALQKSILPPSDNEAKENLSSVNDNVRRSQAPAVDVNPAKHFIKVRSELLNDYGRNPELISGAFPCLFPLGITAEEAGGTGPLNKVQMRTLLLSNER